MTVESYPNRTRPYLISIAWDPSGVSFQTPIGDHHDIWAREREWYATRFDGKQSPTPVTQHQICQKWLLVIEQLSVK
jgi:hypothetical protein